MTATVSEIVSYLPANADGLYGWNETKILSILAETNNSLAQTVRRFWYERWSNTTENVDITDATVKTSLSQVHANAKSMLDYWDERVKAENIDNSARRQTTFGRIERPYGRHRRGYGWDNR